MSEFPKPNFPDFSDNNNNGKSSTPNCSPDLHRVQKNVYSAGSSPPQSPHQQRLTGSSKKSLNLFLSFSRSLENLSVKIYDFCEHNYNENLVQLIIDMYEKHLLEFKELKNGIISQRNFDESVSLSELPPSVKFFISSYSTTNKEEWPENTSDDWVETARYYLKGPVDFGSPANKDNRLSLEERLLNASRKKRLIDNTKMLEIRKQTNKIRRVIERRHLAKEEAMSAYNEKQEQADQRREAIMNSKIEKARNETEKAQETKYLAELDAEDKKVQLEKKTDMITKRHEEMVRATQEKARERVFLRAQPSPRPNRKRPSVKPGKLSVLESIGCGQLPGDFFGDDTQEEIVTQFPVLTEPVCSPSRMMDSLEAKMKDEPNESKHAIKYLKMAMDSKSSISSVSEAGECIRRNTKQLLIDNSSFAHNALRYISSFIHKIYPLAFKVGVDSIDVFSDLCKKPDSLQSSCELFELWITLLAPSSPNDAKYYLVESLSKSSAFDRLCFIFSAVNASDLTNERLKQLLVSAITLLKTCSLVFKDLSNPESKPSYTAFLECLERIVIPQLISFFAMMSRDPDNAPGDLIASTASTVSLLITQFPEVTACVDETVATPMNLAMRAFLNKDSDSNYVKELILLYGILCKDSEVQRSAALWAPTPTVLSLLCELPLKYFIKKPDSSYLIPTIAAACIDSVYNVEFVNKKISSASIVKYLESADVNTSDILSVKHRIPIERLQELIDMFKNVHSEDNL